MDPALTVLAARRRCGWTQRELAQRTGVAQPTIARIEKGQVDPMIGTVLRLLRACGTDLRAEPEPGFGVDRTQIRELLALTPAQRLERARTDAAGLAALEQAVRR